MVFEIQMYYVKLRMSIYVHELCEPLLTDICSVLWLVSSSSIFVNQHSFLSIFTTQLVSEVLDLGEMNKHLLFKSRGTRSAKLNVYNFLVSFHIIIYKLL